MALVLAVNFEFAGFRKQKNTRLITASVKRSVWENPDQERTKSARIWLKNALPFNNVTYFMLVLNIISVFLIECD